MGGDAAAALVQGIQAVPHAVAHSGLLQAVARRNGGGAPADRAGAAEFLGALTGSPAAYLRAFNAQGASRVAL